MGGTLASGQPFNLDNSMVEGAILHFNKWVAPDALYPDMDRKIVV